MRKLIILSLTLLGCSDVDLPSSPTHAIAGADERMLDASDPAIERIAVLPRATDPAIDIALDEHLVRLADNGRRNGRLLVFLASSRVAPSTAELFQQEAALVGYRVIGLSYPNTPGLASFCPSSVDPQGCYENVRLQVITGEPQTGLVPVNEANSIDNRLLKLLEYLDATYPGEAWSQFLNSGGVKWHKIAVAGHSQGAGHAAMIAKLRRVDRVVMLSGVTDGVGLTAARWVTPGATPAERYFGLAHARDAQFLPYDRANWSALGLDAFGAPVAPEATEPPYAGTHTFVTDILPRTGTFVAPAPHASTGVDFAVPVGADGAPILRPVWRYMLGY